MSISGLFPSWTSTNVQRPGSSANSTTIVFVEDIAVGFTCLIFNCKHIRGCVKIPAIFLHTAILYS
jgi:hypothetical protein